MKLFWSLYPVPNAEAAPVLKQWLYATSPANEKIERIMCGHIKHYRSLVFKISSLREVFTHWIGCQETLFPSVTAFLCFFFLYGTKTLLMQGVGKQVESIITGTITDLQMEETLISIWETPGVSHSTAGRPLLYCTDWNDLIWARCFSVDYSQALKAVSR